MWDFGDGIVYQLDGRGQMVPAPGSRGEALAGKPGMLVAEPKGSPAAEPQGWLDGRPAQLGLALGGVMLAVVLVDLAVKAVRGRR